MAAGVGVLLIVLGGAWWWLGGGQGDSRRVRDNAPHQSGNGRDARSTSGRDGARPSQVDSRRVGDNAPRQGGGRGATALPGRDGAPTPQDEPKTNNVQWIVPPLDPDDPDNALRTRTAQELGSILSVTPGDPIPPFPYAFLVEDEQKASGEPADNGNNSFLDSLRKIQIRAKETDSDSITKHKEKLVAAQMELLDGIKEGLSVNDTIRSAYEFRVRAHEYRNSAIETLREWAAENPTRADFDRTLAELNAKLSEEGIKTIPPEEVVPELEDEAQEAQGAEAQGAEKK